MKIKMTIGDCSYIANSRWTFILIHNYLIALKKLLIEIKSIKENFTPEWTDFLTLACQESIWLKNLHFHAEKDLQGFVHGMHTCFKNKLDLTTHFLNNFQKIYYNIIKLVSTVCCSSLIFTSLMMIYKFAHQLPQTSKGLLCDISNLP